MARPGGLRWSNTFGVVGFAFLCACTAGEPIRSSSPIEVADASSSCASFVAVSGGTQLDLAPPFECVDVCSQDSNLCQFLTSGYPPTATTLAYFVTPKDWDAYQQRSTGFTRYLIAQSAGSTTPDELPQLKSYIRAQQGDVPDSTRLPAMLRSRGRVNIGVFDETPDSISFGTVMSLRTGGPTSRALSVVATNTALVLKDRLLSLYVFTDFSGAGDVEGVKRLTLTWLQCLRHANSK